MSFAGFLDNSNSSGGRLVGENNNNIGYSNNMPSGAISQPRLVTQSFVKSMINPPGLSLALVCNLSLTLLLMQNFMCVLVFTRFRVVFS